MTVREHILLAPHTTFNIGGPAEFFVVADSEESVQEACAYARTRSLPVTVLGGGSNVLIHDKGISGVVIKNEVDGIHFDTEGTVARLTIGSGVLWDTLVSESVARGLWGLENLSGIPGTVGGAVVQNINAYGVTIAEYVEEVRAVYIKTGEVKIFTPEECCFAYRNSFFKKQDGKQEYVVTSVRLRLASTPCPQTEYQSASQSMMEYFAEYNITHPSAEDVRNAILTVRAKIGMLAGMFQSAGSFFTNVILEREAFVHLERSVVTKYAERSAQYAPWHWPLPDGREKVSTAFLMECTEFNKTEYGEQSWRGVVGISPLHTLSIVTNGNARAADVQEFANVITRVIKEKFDVTLTSEICFL